MAKRSKAWGTRRIYEFIKAHRHEHDVQTMCSALEVTRSGYYAWLREPVSNRAQDDARLLRLIRASFTASHGIYGSPRVFLDLREAGEPAASIAWRASCGSTRSAPFMAIARATTRRVNRQRLFQTS